VIIPAPYWVSYPDMVLACDGTPVTVACPEADGFRLTPRAGGRHHAADALAAAQLAHQPDGCQPTAQKILRALADVLLRHPQVLVMTDDIYEHIRFDGEDRRTSWPSRLALRDRTLVVNGVSKTYAMTGWRIGYAAGPAT
jgi:aspartate aminotransferase